MIQCVYHSNNAKKATAYVEPVKRVFVWCKDAEWCSPEDSSKPTLNFKLLTYILEGFVQTVSRPILLLF